MLRQVTPVVRNVVNFSRISGIKTACTVLIYWTIFYNLELSKRSVFISSRGLGDW